MGAKLYVGNLNFDTNSEELQQVFAEHGEVRSADVVVDRETGRSRGFGFVEMGSDEDADRAREALNGQEVGGRRLNVDEARPKREGGGGGGGGGGRW